MDPAIAAGFFLIAADCVVETAQDALQGKRPPRARQGGRTGAGRADCLHMQQVAVLHVGGNAKHLYWQATARPEHGFPDSETPLL